jgi:hypothetical protein
MPRSEVDVGWLEQPDAVVVAQGFDAEVGGSGEVPDGQRRFHGSQYEISPWGRHEREFGSCTSRWGTSEACRGAVNRIAE